MIFLRLTLPALFLAIELVAYATQANVRVVVVDAFGQSATQCSVDEFVDGRDATRYDAPDRRDFSKRFSGLLARDIPYGEYWVTAQCADGSRANRMVRVSRPEALLVLTSTKRRGDHHAGGGATLQVRIEGIGDDSNGIIWIRAVGIFSDVDEVAPVDTDKRMARFYTTTPGSYAIYVAAAGGLTCAGRLDLLDAGGTAIIRDVRSCAITFLAGSPEQ